MCRPTDIKSVFRTVPSMSGTDDVSNTNKSQINHMNLYANGKLNFSTAGFHNPNFLKLNSSYHDSMKVDTDSESKEKKNNKNFKSGRWSDLEHETFLQALKQYGKNWKEVSNVLKTRSPVQVRTHAQKFFIKVAQKNASTGEVDLEYTSLKKDTAILSKCLELASKAEHNEKGKSENTTESIVTMSSITRGKPVEESSDSELSNSGFEYQISDTSDSESSKVDKDSDLETFEILKNLDLDYTEEEYKDDAMFSEQQSSSSSSADEIPEFQPSIQRTRKLKSKDSFDDYSHILMSDIDDLDLEIFPSNEDSHNFELKILNCEEDKKPSRQGFNLDRGFVKRQKLNEYEDDKNINDNVDIDLVDLLTDDQPQERSNEKMFQCKSNEENINFQDNDKTTSLYENLRSNDFPYEANRARNVKPEKIIGWAEVSSSSLDRKFTSCFSREEESVPCPGWETNDNENNSMNIDDLEFEQKDQDQQW